MTIGQILVLIFIIILILTPTVCTGIVIYLSEKRRKEIDRKYKK